MAGLALPRSIFNSGVVFAIPPGSNVEPIRFGVLQSLQLDVSCDLVELAGENFAIEDAQKKNIKIGGKITFKKVNPSLLLAAWPASAKTTAGRKFARHPAQAIPGTPFQITVTNSATWITDLGVYNQTTGVQMECVASAPSAGQYSVAAGVYTFASAEGTVVIDYAYTAATGDLITVTNAIAEAASTYYALEAYNTTSGLQTAIQIPRAVIAGLSIPFAGGDFAGFETSFTAVPDANGIPLKVYFNA